MKKYLFCLILGILAFNMCVHAQEDKKELYNRKIKQFTHVRKFGIGMTGMGILMTAGGIAVALNARDSEDGKKFLALVIAEVGVVAMIGGITLWTVGNQRKYHYRYKLKTISLNLNQNVHRPLSLVFNF